MTPLQAISDRSYPAALRAAFAVVGEPQTEFRPHAGRLAAGVLFGLVLIGISPMFWSVMILTGVVTFLGVAIIGVCLFLRSVAQCYFICPRGLVRSGWGRVEICPWADIHSATQGTDQKGLLILRKSGDSWNLTNLDPARIRQLGQVVRPHVEQHRINWTIVEHD